MRNISFNIHSFVYDSFFFKKKNLIAYFAFLHERFLADFTKL
jgi:hypothetical protein